MTVGLTCLAAAFEIQDGSRQGVLFKASYDVSFCLSTVNKKYHIINGDARFSHVSSKNNFSPHHLLVYQISTSVEQKRRSEISNDVNNKKSHSSILVVRIMKNI